MTWALFALLTALFESAKDVFSKKALQEADPLLVAWAWRFFALPFLLPLLLVIEIPPLGPDFWSALVAGGGLNVLTSVLYMQALKASDLSLTVPLVSFTPLFLLITSPLLLGEHPGPLGLAGVLLIVAGSYLMKAGEWRRGYLAPFRALWRERGPRLMLLVALIWSITANIDKIGLRNSSPLFWAVAINLFIACILLPAVFVQSRRHTDRGQVPLQLLGIGVAGALTTICQMLAISLTLVPYVIAIKRTSTAMGVLWGHFLFGEKGVRERMAGTITMLLGMILILLQ